MKNDKSILALALALAVALIFTGGWMHSSDVAFAGEKVQTGGVICLKVNPEIAVYYDGEGKVIQVEPRNRDGREILAGYAGYEGRPASEVVAELVAVVGEKGYFTEEKDGVSRKIVLELENGSVMPYDAFLYDVLSGVRDLVRGNGWRSPIDIEGESDYGITDYVDTDYGPGNDGNTDYGVADYGTDYGPDSDGVTDYFDTDYGPYNDGYTDYGTDYGPGSDGDTDYGATDYDDTDYGPDSDGVTDYFDTDYGPYNDGDTDYGATDYDDTDYGPNNDGVTDYHDSGYGNTNYGDSNYNDSGYGDSDYDD